eukprot:CAMPEP_0174721416 /NCGR_PEP_ID=MMETSP1094-20130205/36148_1 /TAXON_ID=156173 /ORGANISM="Chrysochromulina brevifilum, Strain UTEX LB 985" /LENGTH=133 /DNA_ID=CAMNT_0015922099 /DNA_START=25 /DNA_END=427 /DNA_ORIENTATION=-
MSSGSNASSADRPPSPHCGTDSSCADLDDLQAEIDKLKRAMQVKREQEQKQRDEQRQQRIATAAEWPNVSRIATRHGPRIDADHGQRIMNLKKGVRRRDIRYFSYAPVGEVGQSHFSGPQGLMRCHALSGARF